MQLSCHSQECPYGKIYRIDYAVWGIQAGNCPDFSYTYLCHQDISIAVEKRCKGQQSCTLGLEDGNVLFEPAGQIINSTKKELGQCDKGENGN